MSGGGPVDRFPNGLGRRPLRPWHTAAGRSVACCLAAGAALLGAAAPVDAAQVRLLLLIVDFADAQAPSLVAYTDGGQRVLPLTTTGAEIVFFENASNPSSTAARYEEMSYQQAMLVGDVAEVGIGLGLSESTVGEWRPAADAGAIAQGYDPSDYDRVGYLLPFGFESQIGNGGAEQGGTWFWATPPFAGSFILNERTVRHELGHTFGMRHASELQAGGATLEVADESCFLGSGDAVHAHALNKRAAGWLEGSRWADHPLDALSTYVLRGLGDQAATTQAVSIETHGALEALGAPVETVLSFRPALGLDTIPRSVDDPFGTQLRGRVHVHHMRRDGKGFPTLERALEAGDGTVVNGAVVRVLSIGAAEATVEIDQQPYLPSPAQIQAVPVAGSVAMPSETIEFELEVTNADPPGIGFPAWYTSSFGAPTAFWTVAWDVTPKEILVAPGATETIDGLRVRAPQGTAPGMYTISVTLVAEGSAGPVPSTVQFPVEIVPSPDTTPPPPPSGLGGTIFLDAPDDYVVLSWTEPSNTSDVAVYQPYRNGVALPTPASRNPIYLDFVFAGNEPNAYVVRSVDAAGNESPPTAVFTAGIADTSPPSAPSDVSAALGPGGVQLGWTTPFDDVWVAEYEVRRDDAVVGTSSEPSFVDPMPPGGTSRYTVFAIDGWGNRSPVSNAASIQVNAVPALPTGPLVALGGLLAAGGARRLGTTRTCPKSGGPEGRRRDRRPGGEARARRGH